MAVVGGDLGRRSSATISPRAPAQAHIEAYLAAQIASSSLLGDDHASCPPHRASAIEGPHVVALVKADRRFVEHIEHASEARQDLGASRMRWLAARQLPTIAGVR
jgi:hypothetical protein